MYGNGLPDLREPSGRVDGPPYPIFHRCLRGEHECVPAEFGCGGNRRAAGRFVRRRLDLGRHPRVRALGAERTVAGALDAVTSDQPELGMHRADGGGTGVLARRGRQQRMIELDQLTSASYHPGCLRLSQSGRPTDPHQRLHGRPRQESAGQHRPPSGRGQASQPSCQDRAVPLRDWEILDTGRRGRRSPGKLDGQIRVAAREPVQCRRPSRCRHPTSAKRNHMRDLGLGQRTDRDHSTRLRHQGRNTAVDGAAHGRDNGELPVGEPADGKPEHTTCRGVQPLHIVKDQKKPPVSRHRLKDLEHREIRRQRVGPSLGRLRAQQHHLQGAAQRPRQIRSKLVDLLANEIKQAEERQVRLRGRSPRTTHREPEIGRNSGGRIQQRRLPDTRRPGNEDRTGRFSGQARMQLRELTCAPHDT
jgi:hypothetical protein